MFADVPMRRLASRVSESHVASSMPTSSPDGSSSAIESASGMSVSMFNQSCMFSGISSMFVCGGGELLTVPIGPAAVVTGCGLCRDGAADELVLLFRLRPSPAGYRHSAKTAAHRSHPDGWPLQRTWSCVDSQPF